MALPTRRRFLNNSLGVAAALSAGSALAAEAVPGERQSTPDASDAAPEPRAATRPSISSANDRINVAVIGCGGRGQYHIGELMSLSDHVNVVALCDPDAGQLEQQAQRVDEEMGALPKTYQDVRKLLEDKEVDAVTVATTNHWHALASIWAVQAGKDVFVEKPLSHNVVEGRRLVQYARKHDRVVLHGTQSRSMRSMRQAMQFIQDGHLGKINLARATCYKRRNAIGLTTGERPVPPGVDNDLYCGPAPLKAPRRKQFHYDWHWFWDYGNGDIGNQGVHQMDIAMWGLNKRELPTQVCSIGGRVGYEDDAETPNTQVSVLRYADGAEVIFEVRGLESKPVPGAKNGVANVFYGTEGTLVVHDYDDCVAYAPDGTKIEMPHYETGAAGNHFTSFIKAVRSRKLAFEAGECEAGHLSSAMCHLSNISYLLGTKQPFEAGRQAFGDDRAAYATLDRLESHLTARGLKLHESDYMIGADLTFDPKNERFTNNDAANRLLTREYRAPFLLPEPVA
jgi:predicted dehydrogenase